MFDHSANFPPNHSPKVENSAPCVFVELTTSQNSGSSAYSSMTVIRMFSSTECRLRLPPRRGRRRARRGGLAGRPRSPGGRKRSLGRAHAALLRPYHWTAAAMITVRMPMTMAIAAE